MRKNGFKKDLPAFPPREFFFMFILLISNHTVFLVQFGINLHLRVPQKAEKLTRANQFQIELETV